MLSYVEMFWILGFPVLRFRYAMCVCVYVFPGIYQVCRATLEFIPAHI